MKYFLQGHMQVKSNIKKRCKFSFTLQCLATMPCCTTSLSCYMLITKIDYPSPSNILYAGQIGFAADEELKDIFENNNQVI